MKTLRFLLTASAVVAAAALVIPVAASAPEPTFTFARTWVGQTATSCTWNVTATWKHANVRRVDVAWWYDYFPGDAWLHFTRGSSRVIQGHNATYPITVDGGQISWVVIALYDKDDNQIAIADFTDRTTECTLPVPESS